MEDKDQPAPAVDTNQIIEERKAKLKALRSAGNAFPNDFRRTHLAADLHRDYDAKPNEELEPAATKVTVAGRMMLKRVMGKASFATLQDMSGRIQLYISNDVTSEESHAAFKHWDLGDILGAEGTLFKTRTGELSVKVTGLRLLSKSLRPLPEKFHGLADQEQKYRQRYLDLITNPESQRVFKARSGIIQAIREFFVARGYLEVETPMMQPIPGGAAARPFVTHHNALDMQLYLRIAPELYLKRLVVGGLDRVYEINRSFRNEGISTQHNPEFTMLEFYQAYADYADLMVLTEEMFAHLGREILGATTLRYQGEEVNLAGPWPRQPFFEAISTAVGSAVGPETDEAVLRKAAVAAGVPEPGPGVGAVGLWKDVFDSHVEPALVQPTFITDFPIELSPLSKRKDADPRLVDRFELFVCRREIANAYTELNDPLDQRRRFEEQARERERGDEEAHWMDEDFVRALEYGMPPTAGEGIGVDRLAMLFTDSASIRDVILFPHLRPERRAAGQPAGDDPVGDDPVGDNEDGEV